MMTAKQKFCAEDDDSFCSSFTFIFLRKNCPRIKQIYYVLLTLN
ncbi:hypothetical protein LEP1GSC021_1022 [Leptospira noguchii str. 1993005606]|uniref:Uncharacterized protein n=2 Tax=Leptospira noguchii TaxID=28182 RepID=M6YH98_9LEPT|nr:hypothetical protein LEP1GSC035_4450 [Leptospira noguchii str. 2007001578]EMO91226.1 hypothetical protein LEP1GSC024_0210 [Leptospira noguchii str. 2001034031]EPE84419.1 hypothetical protein LEP1GSC021_1022 [Leptospira noguchii str. 1993005606]